MKYIVIASTFVIAVACMSCRNRTDLASSAQTEELDSVQVVNNSPTTRQSNDGIIKQSDDSTSVQKYKITAELAYKGVNNYCHSAYDWSIAKENPSIMYVQMGEETKTEYKVIFRSYTGAFVYFFVDKATGKTRMVEHVPSMNIEEESGTIDLLEYLK